MTPPTFAPVGAAVHAFVARYDRTMDRPAPVDSEPDGIPRAPIPPESGLLSSWYMPAATRRVHGWRAVVVVGIIVVLLVLEALGLCSVFGQVVIG